MNFLAIGDTTIDEFIKLKEAQVNCDNNREHCTLSIPWGDKISFDSSVLVPAVGNAANAAVAAARLGLSAGFVSNVGRDQFGEDILATFAKEHVDTTYVAVNDGIPTNHHYVLWYEAERTILIKHEKYERTIPQFEEPPTWFYLTSLADGTEDFQHWIAKYAKDNSVKLCFQPGTFQIKMGKDALADVYAATEIFFCNKEEAQMILGTPKEHDIKNLLNGIRALGPRLAVITDGRNGSSIMTNEGAWSMPMYPDPAPPVSRTGAGDASASTTVAYLFLGLPPHEALMRGLVNAASVVQKIGAQTGLLTKEEIEAWYEKRPPEFKATAI